MDKSPFHGHSQRTQLSPGPVTPAPGTACVVVIHGSGLGKRVDVMDTPLRIGRGQDCALRIAHPSVSRQHCELQFSEGSYRLRDLGATNRTRVNNEPVEQAELHDGDLLTVGESLLKFISHESPEAHYHEEVHQLATHDALTGLSNRRHFLELLDHEIARAQRHHRHLSLCLFDVDLFKPINDQYGHPVGDTVLQKVAEQLGSGRRREDLVARIGGEEFALILPETALAAAHQVADVLRQAVAAVPVTLGGEPRQVTVSGGVAQLDAEIDTRPALLRAADVALYRAKDSGRNRICSAEAGD